MDFNKTWNAEEIRMYSDAAKSQVLGFGGYCDNSWTFGQWDSSFIVNQDPSIEFLELFAVLTVAMNWLYRFTNKRIVLFCDNQAVVGMINKSTSSCPRCLHLIRLLILHSMKVNVKVYAKYVNTKANKAADLLSRLRIKQFKQLSGKWDDEPTLIPTEIWPIDKVWKTK